MVIQTKKLGAEIQPTMYGLFFEDINYAADGGLYAELVKNRSHVPSKYRQGKGKYAPSLPYPGKQGKYEALLWDW